MDYNFHLFNFIKTTIIGQERGLYRIVNHIEKGINLKDKTTNQFLIQQTVEYLNNCYKSYIKRDDEYVVNKLDEMTRSNNHSKVCTFLKIFYFIQHFYLTFDRNNLVTDRGLEQYMISFEKCSNIQFAKLLENILISYPHECKGDDIDKQDSNVNLFYYK